MQIISWNNTKTNDNNLVFIAINNESITFSVSTDNPANEYIWYVNRQKQTINNSSFTWTVPTGINTWNITVEARDTLPVIGVDLSKFAFNTWTVTTSQIINVSAGQDIQAAIDSLPVDGGIVELSAGTWNLNTEHIVTIYGKFNQPITITEPSGNNILPDDTFLQITSNKACISVEARKNITIRGQGKTGINQTHLVSSSSLIGSLIKIYMSNNIHVYGLHIESSLSGSYIGIEIESSHDCTIGDITAHNFRRDDICLIGHTTYPYLNPEYPIYDITVRNVECGITGSEGIIIGYNRNAYRCEVYNAHVYDCAFGIKFDSTVAANWEDGNQRNKIINTHVENSANYCIYVYSGSFNTDIINCEMKNFGWSGIQMYGASNCIFEKNYIHNGGSAYGGIGGVDLGSYTANNIIKNNIIHTIQNKGIFLQIPSGLPMPNINIVNNTIYGCISDGIYLAPEASISSIVNNILMNCGNGISKGSGTRCQYNDLFNISTGICPDTTNITLNPQFINPTLNDFHLQYTSPCIDAGDPLSDYSNEPIPNTRIDMGAYGNTKEATSSAPPSYGNISGIVTDGLLPLLGALVLVDTGQNITTSVNGGYNLLSILTGMRTVTASKIGYPTITKNIVVTENTTSTLDFQLIPDIIPPSINSVVSTPFSNGTIITWVTDEPSSSQVEFGTSTNYGSFTPIDNILSINHSVTITGLQNNTLYNYRVRSIDTSGNERISVNYTFTTLVQSPAKLIWSFEEGIGNTITDSSGNSNTGTITNATWTVGIIGNNALEFNGLNSEVYINKVPISNIDNFTMIVRVLVRESQTQSQGFIINNGTASNGYGIGITSSGELAGLLNSVAWIFTGKNVTLNVQHHIAMVRMNGVTHIYLDGQDTGVTSLNTPLTPSSYFTIGNVKNFTGRNFKGIIDEVKIFDTALTDQEILLDAGNSCPIPICNMTVTIIG